MRRSASRGVWLGLLLYTYNIGVMIITCILHACHNPYYDTYHSYIYPTQRYLIISGSVIGLIISDTRIPFMLHAWKGYLLCYMRRGDTYYVTCVEGTSIMSHASREHLLCHMRRGDIYYVPCVEGLHGKAPCSRAQRNLGVHV